jgi:outer membrane protein assembly factor BamB
MSTPCAFTVIDRQLLITDPVTGQARWHGSPLGLPVEEVQPLTEGGGAVVLLDHLARTKRTDSNLVCVDCDGQLVWKLSVGSLSSPDAFVSLELVGDELVANSWAGRRVGIDPLTGDIRGAEFTK